MRNTQKTRHGFLDFENLQRPKEDREGPQLFAKCEGFFCTLKTHDGHNYHYSIPVYALVAELETHGFHRIGRGHVVNIHQIVDLIRHDVRKWSVEMADGTMFPIAYRRLAAFKRVYMETRSRGNPTRS